ncbi:MAG TPA: hypothetical protein VNC81_00880 [Xanthobacteraceae bacterium]|nr:hypothetical protein [Xanthobacteraceae bacterium]
MAWSSWQVMESLAANAGSKAFRLMVRGRPNVNPRRTAALA